MSSETVSNNSESSTRVTTRTSPDVIGTCAFWSCKRPVLRNHKHIFVHGEVYHTDCYGEQERLVGRQRFIENVTRKKIREGIRKLKKAMLNKQVCEYFPIPMKGMCRAGESLSLVFRCTKTYASAACECYKLQKQEESNAGRTNPTE